MTHRYPGLVTSSRPIPVLLSSSSVYPEATPAAFELASQLGYDGLEVMVWTDSVSQDAAALRGLSQHYQVPVGAVHAPCLLVTQRVWSPDPWVRLRRSAELARDLGAKTVVVHPPFVWQRDYARTFATGLAAIVAEYPDIVFAVENMFPVRMAGREFIPYAPHWDPTTVGFGAYTLDISHCAAAKINALDLLASMGERVAHLHLGDGAGRGGDEHLVPGRGAQPCAETLTKLLGMGFAGAVTLEVNTRKATSHAQRETDLAESLAFARRYLGAETKVRT